ncbi:sigma 54-interacting transcriptional regulator [Desulfallas sp. Bu1-1]|uniref:sigma-54 interaction domain-containing protein n=1 Tax=Desulfallas sp. Bu1-1 TaxID=2787620 RepID=UPI00189FB851|nr:sigma 54-interacting transcriptional regulator [Desulfallas sp. Bu1-1]MBF7083850.1 sigma 54-interacting transcriptional regulator [Desulfallas sp. Bu1-1]
MTKHTIKVDTTVKKNDLMIQSKIFGEELRLYKEKWLEVFLVGDVLYDGIYIIDNNGTVISVNKAFIKMTGITEEEIIGQSVKLLVKKGIFTKPASLMALKKREKISIITNINNQKIVATANPIFNEIGEVVQVLTVLRDVTYLIKLHEKLEYSEKLTKKYISELDYLRKRDLDQSRLIGKSSSISQIKEVINQVAQTDVTVLITGETGVGKEIVANEIQRNSTRKDSPYIKVNCAAIPDTLLESELFGYEKGAFTGAQNKEKLGLFEIANSGTILLDEIGEMPIKLQSKLLRVLQEKEIIRLGGTKPIKLDIRLIAATNQKLEEQVKNGLFRQDLYYRLNVVPIHVPPLRSRLEDIPLLVNHFLHKYNEKYKKDKYVDSSAIEIMQQYDWPGNVRELEHVVERLVVIVTDPEIRADHIIKIIDNKKLPSVYFDKSNLTLKEAVRMVERQMIQSALKTYGSTHKAARALGVSQPTVLRKAKELGVTAE